MKKLVLFLIVLSLSSCALFKKVNKKDTEQTDSTEIVSQKKREGDTVTFFVPSVKYKDTTIYTVNRVGTRIETRYNNEGQIDRIDCYASAIEELTKINRELVTAISEKEKEEEFKMDKTFLIVAGIVFLIIIFGLGLYVHSQIGGIKKLLP